MEPTLSDVLLASSESPLDLPQQPDRTQSHRKAFVIGGALCIAVLLFGYVIVKNLQSSSSPEQTVVDALPTVFPTGTQVQDNSELTIPSSAPIQISGTETIDELFEKVATRNPGFCGMSVDDRSDMLYVYLREGDLSAVVVDLHTVFGEEDLPKNVQALPCTFGFAELKRWYDQIALYALAIPGVSMSDIDEVNNRITIGVYSQEARAAVEKKATELGIPSHAIIIIDAEPVRML